MVVQHILRVRRTDHSSQHVLVNVAPNGRQPLDLKFVATDQEHLFHVSIKESGIQSLQSNDYTADMGDWKTIISYVFLQQQPEEPLPEYLQNIELVAKIVKQTMTLTVQKNIDGITQRLGQLTLDEDDEREEVAAFDWVDAAVATSDDLRAKLESLQLSLVSQQAEVSKLTSQLDSLVQAKREHEEELLGKFAALLNSKKLKIRDQQRLLSGAKVDAKTAEAVHQARSTNQQASWKPDVSRNSKRRAGPSMDEENIEENVNAGDDDTDSDANDTDRRRQETPEGSDAEATDDEDGGGGLDKDGVGSGNEPSETMELDAIPPRRELPFARKPTSKTNPQIKAPADNDDEETDDEL